MPIPSYRPDNPDTYLSSVNSVLAAIGQAPVETIDQDNPELMMILQIIMETAKDTQAEGWVFNTENHYPMEPDADGYIEIKEHVLRLDISEGQTWRTSDVVRRPKPVAQDADPVKSVHVIKIGSDSCPGCVRNSRFDKLTAMELGYSFEYVKKGTEEYEQWPMMVKATQGHLNFPTYVVVTDTGDDTNVAIFFDGVTTASELKLKLLEASYIDDVRAIAPTDDPNTYLEACNKKESACSDCSDCKYDALAGPAWVDNWSCSCNGTCGSQVYRKGPGYPPSSTKSDDARGKYKTTMSANDDRGAGSNWHQLCKKKSGSSPSPSPSPSPEPTPDPKGRIDGPQSHCVEAGKNKTVTLKATVTHCSGKSNGRWAIMRDGVYRRLDEGDRGVTKLTDTELEFDSTQMNKFVDLCEEGEWRFRHLIDCGKDEVRSTHIIKVEKGCCDDPPPEPGNVEIQLTCPSDSFGMLKVIVKGANGGIGRWYINGYEGRPFADKEDINEDRYKSEIEPLADGGVYWYMVDYEGKTYKSELCELKRPETPEPPPPPEPEPCPDDLNVPISPECDSDGVPDPDPWPDSETVPTVVLYDKMHHTFFFPCCVLCDVVWLLPFPALPPAFQRYITSRASVRAAAQLVNNPQLFQLLQQQEATARAACMEYETTQGDYSFMGFPDGTVYQTYQPWQTLDRNY